jgi:23S rRNA (guanosine2251-2'-O)-methyltransferase
MKLEEIVIEGRNTVHDALLSKKNIDSLFISKNVMREGKIRDIVSIANKKNVPIKLVSAEDIVSLSKTKNAQGVIAYMSDVKEITLESILQEKENPLILMFNKLDYEQNLGAILRSSWGAGVDAVVVSPQGVSKLTPVVAKVSQGGAAHVPLLAESLFPAMKLLKEYNIPLVGVDMGVGESYTDLTLLGPVAFVFGGEDSGISEPMKKYIDIYVHIPMTGELSSLNVSVATALIIFEKRRQERTAKK